ncbi:MAG TPA: hypothetical protein VHG51_05885 [Longimicrobiaceae bacterium]|nr:hypothetical protein [Longimicrobiaceae bacterium]
MYGFLAVLILLVAAFFTYVTIQQNESLQRASAPEPQGLVAAGAERDAGTVFLDAQYRLVVRRYQHAAASTFSNAARTNVAFLVGTIISLTGCLVIVRRVRETPVEASWDAGTALRSRLTTSSPGIVLASLGTVIIVSTIFADDSVVVEDDGVTSLPGWTTVPAPPQAPALVDDTTRLESVIGRI